MSIATIVGCAVSFDRDYTLEDASATGGAAGAAGTTAAGGSTGTGGSAATGGVAAGGTGGSAASGATGGVGASGGSGGIGGSAGSSGAGGAAGASATGGTTSAGGTGGSTGGSGGTGASGGASGSGGTAGSATGGSAGTAGSAGSGTCSGSDECVDAPPAGWEGPVALYFGAQAAPLCSGAYPSLGPEPRGGASGAAASCSTCTCAPQNLVCSLKVSFWDGAGCAGSGVQLPVSGYNGGICTGPSGPSIAAKIELAPTVTAASSCTPSGGTAQAPQVQYATTVRACTAGNLQACGANRICAPPSPSAFIGGVCIYSTVDTQCPTGSYSALHVFYNGVDDTRGCSSCTCGALTGATCSGTVDVYGNDSECLSASEATLTATGTQCVPLTNGDHYATYTQAVSGGTCPATGGQPVGSVAQKNQITFCCR